MTGGDVQEHADPHSAFLLIPTAPPGQQHSLRTLPVRQ